MPKRYDDSFKLSWSCMFACKNPYPPSHCVTFRLVSASPAKWRLMNSEEALFYCLYRFNLSIWDDELHFIVISSQPADENLEPNWISARIVSFTTLVSSFRLIFMWRIGVFIKVVELFLTHKIWFLNG